MGMKFVLSNSMTETEVQNILNEFATNSQERIPCYLAMDNDHPLKQMVFKFLRETDLPWLRNQVTCNNWSEWATNHHHL